MQPSLESIGRFDPARAKARLLDNFQPHNTWLVKDGNALVGFYVLIEEEHRLHLDHLYVQPNQQGKGIGGLVIDRVIARAQLLRLPIELAALKESPANEFYKAKGFRLTHQEQWDNYYQYTLTSPQSVVLALTNPKSPTNVGAVMRAAGCFSADKVQYTGSRFDIAAKFQTDTKNVSNRIALEKVDSFFDNLDPDMKVVCVDLVEGATPLMDFKHPAKAIYVFGPEDSSITQADILKADEVVYIPTVGCLNLAATVNVLLYDRLAKNTQVDRSNELIIRSRDRNNKTRVKS
jgi:tRNA(Leu) C34 or U34 (ribose-2'-O)-methylase TrmL/N-acetylglutamate synthase-like GNAT family acetyltransferase